jgi:type I restriction-modification system DNA methylase subunit
VDIVLTNPPFGGREEDGIESNFPQHFRTRETADLFLALIVRLLKSGGRAALVLPDGTLFAEGVKTRLKEHLMDECNLHTIVRLPNSVFKPYASIGTNLLFFEKGTPTKDIWFWEHRVPAGQKAYSMTKPIRFEHLQSCIDWWSETKRKSREEGTERIIVGGVDHGNVARHVVEEVGEIGIFRRIERMIIATLHGFLLRNSGGSYVAGRSRMVSGPFELASLTSWPLAATFRANVAPMFPAPMIPIFMGCPFVNVEERPP